IDSNPNKEETMSVYKKERTISPAHASTQESSSPVLPDQQVFHLSTTIGMASYRACDIIGKHHHEQGQRGQRAVAQPHGQREEARCIMVMGDSEQSTTKESRRQAILEAALACFASKGFTETRMEDIRKISGASTGSIYHHFTNKEMLARALYLEGRSSLNTALLASITTNHLHEGIQAIVHAYLDWFEQHADLGQYIMQAGNSEYLSAYVKVLRQKIRTMLPTENFPEHL